jgi:ligand-binding SRPBCC domain-containing protein
MTRIHLETHIDAPIELVFDLARDLDLHARSMAASSERAVGGRTSGRIDQGEAVTWRARHFGLWWSLTSLITIVEPPTRFVDVQERGPFAWFRHEHRFASIEGGTRMADDWEHVSPSGRSADSRIESSWRATCAACSKRAPSHSRQRRKELD